MLLPYSIAGGEINYTPYTPVETIVAQAAKRHNVSLEVMKTVISCESGFDTKIQSKYINPKTGEREKSFGLVQINLPSHPYVTYEEAIDPYFSAEFLARNLAAGKGSMWTCYRDIYDI